MYRVKCELICFLANENTHVKFVIKEINFKVWSFQPEIMNNKPEISNR
jgi:hypothetical protein